MPVLELQGHLLASHLVMIHKFQERDEAGLPYLDKQPARRYETIEDELVPVFKEFGIVNPSERIIIMIDVVHRTQTSIRAHLTVSWFRQVELADKITNAFRGLIGRGGPGTADPGDAVVPSKLGPPRAFLPLPAAQMASADVPLADGQGNPQPSQ